VSHARAVAAALFWTTILATFCDMISSANPEITEFQQTSTSCHTHAAVCALSSTLTRCECAWLAAPC
jgi:hypothetical protein